MWPPPGLFPKRTPRLLGLRFAFDFTNGAPMSDMTVAAAAESGDTRSVLVATRDRIAVAIDDASTPARDLAALTRRLIDITRDLEAMDAADAEDEIGRALETPDEEFDADSL